MKSVLFISVVLLFLLDSFHVMASECFGSTKEGRLEGGVKLPSSGGNFVSYGKIPELAGRTYVHSQVKKITLEAYKALEKNMPEKKFKYAETGFKQGGRFKPHKTHQNGLSIDFMVPVIDEKGKSVYFSTSPLNKYGYNIEFDQQGKFKNLRIDFEAMAAHIIALHKAAIKNGVDLWRVLFDPALQDQLYRTSNGKYIKENILIPDKKSWVRHDEHYHVDFKIPCSKL